MKCQEALIFLPVDGKIDDVRLYDRPLSFIEVQQLYNEQCTGFSAVLPYDAILCENDVTVLTTSGGDWLDISFAGLITESTVLISAEDTVFQLFVSKYNGFTDTHNVRIHVSKPATDHLITASADTICLDDTVSLVAAAGFINYDWTPNMGWPLDTKVLTVSPSSSTTYFLQVIDSIGCEFYDTVTIVVKTCSGIEKYIPEMQFSIRPTIGNGEYHLERKGEQPMNGSIKVVDIFGREMLNQSWKQSATAKVDIAHLPDGVYLFVINSSGQSLVKKVIKQSER